MFIEYLQCTRMSLLPNHFLFSMCVSGSLLLPLTLPHGQPSAPSSSQRFLPNSWSPCFLTQNNSTLPKLTCAHHWTMLQYEDVCGKVIHAHQINVTQLLEEFVVLETARGKIIIFVRREQLLRFLLASIQWSAYKNALIIYTEWKSHN